MSSAALLCAPSLGYPRVGNRVPLGPLALSALLSPVGGCGRMLSCHLSAFKATSGRGHRDAPTLLLSANHIAARFADTAPSSSSLTALLTSQRMCRSGLPTFLLPLFLFRKKKKEKTPSILNYYFFHFIFLFGIYPFFLDYFGIDINNDNNIEVLILLRTDKKLSKFS